MFQVRELSIKLAGSDEARLPLFACKVCDSTADVTCGPTNLLDLCTPSPDSACPTPSAVPLFACNVCDSTPEGACGPLSVAVHTPEDERGGLQLLREQLSHHLAQLN